MNSHRTVVTLLAPTMPPPAEDTFLTAIINYTNSSTVHFKLSPTYVLYMTCRYVMSSHYRPDIGPSERTHKVIAIVNKMVSMMEGVIQVSPPCRLALSFSSPVYKSAGHSWVEARAWSIYDHVLSVP